MRFKMSDVIRRVQAEISIEHTGECIRWIDENMDNAFSNAIDRFDRDLCKNMITKNDYELELAAKEYSDTCVELIRKYKKAKRVDDASEFISSL